MSREPVRFAIGERRDGEGRRIAAPALALLGLVFAAYLPALGASFIWDDFAHVVSNPTLGSAHGLWRIWTDLRATPQYYPLVHTTFWLEYAAVGPNPALYHLDNVILHGVNTVLLWRLLALLGLPGAWIAAGVFAVHPMQVESVAWITERKNVLSGLFYLLAAHAYLRYAEAEDDGRACRRQLALAWLAFIAALLSKTVTATLPAALALVLWWQRERLVRRDVVTLAPMACLGAAFGLLTAWLERHHVMAQGADWDLSLGERIVVAGRALWFYAGKLAWPDPVAFIYPRWEIDSGDWSQIAFPVAAAALIAVLLLTRRRIGRGPAVAVLFYAGTLFPALGLLDFYPMRYSFVANHFQYLAGIGLIALAAPLLAPATRAPRLRRAIAGALLAALAVFSWRTTLAYADLETLWRDTLSKNPGAWMAHNNLGLVLDASGRREEARRHYRDALRLRPEHVVARHNLARSLAADGRFAESVAELEQAVRLAPENPQYQSSLGEAYLHQGDAAAAAAVFRGLLGAGRDGPLVRRGLARALIGLGRENEAREHLQAALRRDPADAAAASLLLGLDR